jgi:hypothetical protein
MAHFGPIILVPDSCQLFCRVFFFVFYLLRNFFFMNFRVCSVSIQIWTVFNGLRKNYRTIDYRTKESNVYRNQEKTIDAQL